MFWALSLSTRTASWVGGYIGGSIRIIPVIKASIFQSTFVVSMDLYGTLKDRQGGCDPGSESR